MTVQQPVAFGDLDLSVDGLKLATVTFGLNLYTDRSFYDCTDAVLESLRLFVEQSSLEPLRHYATETMREHKPVTKRALGMLPSWLNPGAKQKHYISLDLKSGENYQDAPDFKYEVFCEPASEQANILSMALPAVWAIQKRDEMLGLVLRLADIFPFRSGIAGYSYEVSRYNKKKSEKHAWTLSMRHPGIDIVRIPVDAKAAGGEALRGVGWLTLVGEQLVKQLGGVRKLRSELSEEIDLVETRHGSIIRAGASPAIGDIDRDETLPLYREVYRVLAPWIEAAAAQSMAFQLATEYVERTRAWYARLST